MPKSTMSKHKYRVHPLKSPWGTRELLTRVLKKSALFSKIISDLTFSSLFPKFVYGLTFSSLFSILFGQNFKNFKEMQTGFLNGGT